MTDSPIDLFGEPTEVRTQLVDLVQTTIENDPLGESPLRHHSEIAVDVVMAQVAPVVASLVDLLRCSIDQRYAVIHKAGRWYMLPARTQVVVSADQAELITKIVGPDKVLNDEEEIAKIIASYT